MLRYVPESWNNKTSSFRIELNGYLDVFGILLILSNLHLNFVSDTIVNL